MKTVANTLIILAALAAFAGGSYLLVTRVPWNYSPRVAGRVEGSHIRAKSHSSTAGQRPDNHRPVGGSAADDLLSRGSHSGEGISLEHGAAGVLRSLSVIALTTAIVVRLTHWQRRRKPASPGSRPALP